MTLSLPLLTHGPSEEDAEILSGLWTGLSPARNGHHIRRGETRCRATNSDLLRWLRLEQRMPAWEAECLSDLAVVAEHLRARLECMAAGIERERQQGRIVTPGMYAYGVASHFQRDQENVRRSQHGAVAKPYRTDGGRIGKVQHALSTDRQRALLGVMLDVVGRSGGTHNSVWSDSNLATELDKRGHPTPEPSLLKADVRTVLDTARTVNGAAWVDQVFWAPLRGLQADYYPVPIATAPTEDGSTHADVAEPTPSVDVEDLEGLEEEFWVHLAGRTIGDAVSAAIEALFPGDSATLTRREGTAAGVAFVLNALLAGKYCRPDSTEMMRARLDRLFAERLVNPPRLCRVVRDRILREAMAIELARERSVKELAAHLGRIRRQCG